MNLSATQISELLDGEIVGDKNASVGMVSKIDQSAPNSLTFLANPKYLDFIYSTEASIVLVSKDFIPNGKATPTLIKVDDPYASFTLILDKFFNHLQHKTGIEQPSYIAENSKIGEDIYLGAFAYIGKNSVISKNVKIYPGAYIGDNVTVGEGTVIYAGVKIYSFCIIGKNCTIHAGTVIGGDGFGFAPQKDGSFSKIPQTGNVVIEDNVEIGSNCSIDRATIGSTIIKSGAKLDNLIQIAHNVEIGNNTAIAAQTGISGSTKIGNLCIIGGQVGFGGHITVADRSQIGAQSGIPSSIKEPGQQWNGKPVLKIRESLKAEVVFRNLPDMQKQLRELQQLVKELKEKNEDK